MDDLIRNGIVIILAAGAAAVIVLYGIARLLVLELHAFAAGDMGFVAASVAVVLLISAGYIGTGLWLRRTGRI